MNDNLRKPSSGHTTSFLSIFKMGNFTLVHKNCLSHEKCLNSESWRPIEKECKQDAKITKTNP